MIIEEDIIEPQDPDDISLFGFVIQDPVTLQRKKKPSSTRKTQKDASNKSIEQQNVDSSILSGTSSFVKPTQDDGSSLVVGVGGHHHLSYFDLDVQSTVSDITRIQKYREIAQYPEVDQAIDEIINELIVFDDDGNCVEVRFDEPYAESKSITKIPEKIKKAIINEFEEVLDILKFSENAHDLARRWYTDGRLVYQMLIDFEEKEIRELREIDPTKIKKVKEVDEQIDPRTGTKLYTTKKEFFVYNDDTNPQQTSFGRTNTTSGLQISKDAIIYCPSGLLDESRKNVISYLHKAIKTANQVKMLEDSIVIYRLARAPERRVFYVDTGNLPAKKAEAYLEQVIAKFRNKISYNAVTGALSDSRNVMAMVEDFWLPRCLDLDTKIPLLDGRTVSLRTLIDEYASGKENWVYSISPEGTIVPGIISWAGITRENAEVLDVHLDNGEIITCTPDHKFILRNGKKIEAQNLEPSVSLMPFNKATNKVLKIVRRSDKITTGTITVDGDHIYHDYHNFATAAGIFIMNSSGGKGTEISTLNSGQNLGNIEDLEYFQKKLFRALNVPINRLQQEAQFSLGRTSEISRDEIKFGKFIDRLRKKFSALFYQILRVQLILKNIITPEEWNEYKKYIYFTFLKDNHFTELKEVEILQTRLQTLRDINEYVGTYVSTDWIRKNVLRQSEEEIEEIDKEIEKDKKKFGDSNNDEM